MGEFACQHSVSYLHCQISFMLEPIVKGNSETTEEWTNWHGGLIATLFYNRFKHNFNFIFLKDKNIPY